MQANWTRFISEVNATIESPERKGCDIIFFRGHSDDNYQLLPTLFRHSNRDFEFLESALFYDFVSMAGDKIKNETSWEILFTMRHYGIPTRLLDWTTSFANALYFSINDKTLNNPHIWILDPFELNDIGQDNYYGLVNPNYDLDHDYVKMFIRKEPHSQIKRPMNPVALYPPRNNPRIFAQQGVFTIHGSEVKPLDQIAPKSLKKIYLPNGALKDAESFLTLAGINDYLIYPEFQGLANYLKKKHQL